MQRVKEPDADPQVRLVVLGGLRVERDTGTIPVQLPGRRADLVFAYLTVEHAREVSRDELADALWPQGLPDTWAAALRSVVSDVRRFLDGGGLDGHEMIAATRSGWRLRLPPGVSVDIDGVRSLLASARDQLSTAPREAAAAAIQVADTASLPFLAGHDSEWADRVRGELSEVYRTSLELATDAYQRSGDRRDAIAAAERLVRADPYDEANHRLLIGAFGTFGDHAGARRAYEACVELLERELGVEPSRATAAALAAALEPGPDDIAAVSEPTDPDPSDFETRSVLVVEDHDFQRNAAVALLNRVGVGSVHAASGGEVALELLSRMPRPDIVLCDLDMPGIDGIELIRLIATGNLADAVAIMSALDKGIVKTVGAVGEAYGLQVLGVVEKPLTIAALRELLGAFRPVPTDERLGRVPSVDELAAGLEDGRMNLNLVPIVEVATGRVVAAEAVPHLNALVQGTAAPAGESDDIELVERLYDGLFDLTCAAAHELGDSGADLLVALRLPHTRLPEVHYQGIAGRLATVARKRKVAPESIAVMVGGAFVAGAAPLTLEVMARLRVKGFGVWLDDARLDARLDRLPFTGLRLAPTVLDEAESGPDGLARVRAFTQRARRLRVHTIATGCDDVQRIELVGEAGIGLAQGAVVASPMPVLDAARWLTSWDPLALVAEAP